MVGFYGATAWAGAGDFYDASPAQVTLEVPIGATVNITGGLAQYIQIFYRFAVSAVSIIAASMIMYAGVSWLTAAGNTQRIGEAKERIIAAISGLILTMMSFVLLNTINPQLVELQNPTIQITTVPEAVYDLYTNNPASTSSTDSATGSTAGACPSSSDWVGIYDTLNASSPTAATLYQDNHASSNLGMAKPDVVSHLQTAILAADSQGMTVYVNGDSRTYATQQRLYDCYIKSKNLPNWNSGENCVSECGTQCNLAARPDCAGAPHLQGVALDVAWYSKAGISSSSPYFNLRGYAKGSCNNGKCGGANSTAMATSQTALQTMMKSVGFKRICAEWWHFEFNGISTVLCEPGKY